MQHNLEYGNLIPLLTLLGSLYIYSLSLALQQALFCIFIRWAVNGVIIHIKSNLAYHSVLGKLSPLRLPVLTFTGGRLGLLGKDRSILFFILINAVDLTVKLITERIDVFGSCCIVLNRGEFETLICLVIIALVIPMKRLRASLAEIRHREFSLLIHGIITIQSDLRPIDTFFDRTSV